METPAIYDVGGSKIPSEAGCLYPYNSPLYEPPTTEYYRRLVKKLNLTGSQVAALTGVHSRTVRKWGALSGSEKDTVIPYAPWRLLLIEAGLERYEKD